MQSLFSLTGPPLALASRPGRPPAGHRPGGRGSSVLPTHGDAGRRPQPAPPTEHPGAGTGEDFRGKQAAAGPRTVGKYLVSPVIKALENGWFAGSVSIRSGAGTGMTDRVLRLTRLFRCSRQAAAYADAEAVQWINAARLPVAC